MKSLLRLFQFPGYKITDVRVSTRDKTAKVILDREDSKDFLCYRCGCALGARRGRYRLGVKELSLMGFATTIQFWRFKGDCSHCKKARSEAVDFISEETPHITVQYAEWVGTMCEFAATSRVAKFTKESESTLRRIDLRRMQRYLKKYKIPKVSRIAVDEVYARKKSRYKNENRDQKFFTVITDLNTRRVIWVTESRNKGALDEFFKILGPAACEKIEVVAMDQHDPYRKSVRDNCPNGVVVWDRFHLMQSFNEALNETRKTIHDQTPSKDPAFLLTRGKYRFNFLKKPCRRTEKEKSHIDQVFLENSKFCQLEIIKERMYSMFDQKSEISGLDVFIELGRWVKQAGFFELDRWYRNLERNWDTVKNYFAHRVTSALAEGTNNVIKALKRRAYGYRNMEYFRLKIMQVCGYLNSEWAGKQVVA